jgi:CheY-like chemotaxis protein
MCDVLMPDVDGYEVARQLGAHPELAAIPLVAVTALAMVDDRKKYSIAASTDIFQNRLIPRLL